MTKTMLYELIAQNLPPRGTLIRRWNTALSWVEICIVALIIFSSIRIYGQNSTRGYESMQVSATQAEHAKQISNLTSSEAKLEGQVEDLKQRIRDDSKAGSLENVEGRLSKVEAKQESTNTLLMCIAGGLVTLVVEAVQRRLKPARA